eukprot:superscaffoldBa00000504_g5260
MTRFSSSLCSVNRWLLHRLPVLLFMSSPVRNLVVDANFLDYKLAHKFNILQKLLESPIQANALDGHFLISERIHPSLHVSRIKPVTESPLQPAFRPPPPTWLIDGELAHTVKYLVDREGYSPEEQSCVPAHSILDPELISAFLQSHPDQCGGMSGAIP